MVHNYHGHQVFTAYVGSGSFAVCYLKLEILWKRYVMLTAKGMASGRFCDYDLWWAESQKFH